jgi:hypothetical protein
MKIDTNHPAFTNFLDNVTSNITTNIHVDKYFGLPNDQKLVEQLKVFKIMNNSLRSNVKLDENEYKSFITFLWKRSEDVEKYELSAILKNVLENFDGIYDVTKPIKRTTRKIKTNTKNE